MLFSLDLLCALKCPPASAPKRPPKKARPRTKEAPALTLFSKRPSQKISKNPLKLSKRRPTVVKMTTKKEPRVTQMNHSGLSNFIQMLSRNRLRKGQNWGNFGSGFGWGKNKAQPFTMEAISSAKFSCFFSMPSPFSKRTASLKAMLPPRLLAAAARYFSTVTSPSFTKSCWSRQFSA